jgi:nicotinate phosphoribosyltransferase
MHFAQTMQIPCLGTMSHQIFSFASAVYPVEQANYQVLKLWLETYDGKPGMRTALTDTFGSDNFFKTFPLGYHDYIFEGVRQDSGNPLKFAQKAINYYKSRGIDPKTKKIIFSDSLDPEKCMDIHRALCGEVKDVYALGTNLTNDPSEGSAKPLQIVIKLTEVFTDGDWRSVVKISDQPEKASGNPEEIKRVKQLLNIK